MGANRSGQRALFLLVVAHNVLKPEQLQRLRILSQLCSDPGADRFGFSGCGRWIKRYPRLALRKINFHPRMCIALSDSVGTGSIVVLAGQKTIDDAGRDTAS